jgi:hypothetical protein
MGIFAIERAGPAETAMISHKLMSLLEIANIEHAFSWRPIFNRIAGRKVVACAVRAGLWIVATLRAGLN